MKLKRLSYVLWVAAFGILVSCTQEQILLKILEGEWGVSSVVVDGVPQSQSSYKDMVYVFDKCKESDEFCYGRIRNDSTSTNVEFTYTFGETLDDFSMSYSGNFDEGFIYDVDEHTPTTFVYSFTDTIGVVTQITLNKID